MFWMLSSLYFDRIGEGIAGYVKTIRKKDSEYNDKTSEQTI